MKKTATAFLLFACVFMALADVRSHKAYMFPPTNFGMLLPSGFSLDKLPTRPGVWVFTNAASSRLTFAISGHWGKNGMKTDFKGFAALEYKTNLVRRIVFHSTQFSHAEIEKNHLAPADYSRLLEYKAANPEDGKILDQAVESLFMKTKKSNKTQEGIGEELAEPSE